MIQNQMVDQFNIRLATRQDEPAIQRVIRTVYEEYGWPWFPDGYHQDLYDIDKGYFDKGGYFWVGELHTEVIATTALEVFPSFPGIGGVVMVDGAWRGAGCDCSLERLYMLKQGRGKGFGAALLRHTAEYAKAIGCRRMEIWSDKKLLDGHKLYERAGAKPIGERLCHDPDQSPEWGLIIDL